MTINMPHLYTRAEVWAAIQTINPDGDPEQVYNALRAAQPLGRIAEIPTKTADQRELLRQLQGASDE